MDINEVFANKFQGVEIPEPVKEKVIAVISEYENNLGKLNSDLEFQKFEAKKAFEKRDEVKNEFRAYKTQVVSGQAPEVQELSKKVLEYESKFDELNNSLTDVTSKYTSAETKLKEINENQRKALLAELPEGSDARKFADGLDDLDKLSNFLKVAKAQKIGVDSGRAGGDLKVDANKSYDDYTAKELEEMKSKFPEAYKTLYKKKYPRS